MIKAETMYPEWLKLLDEWRNNHGITRKQAMSILFNDSRYNPKNPEKDNVIIKDLFWAGVNDFHFLWMKEKGEL